MGLDAVELVMAVEEKFGIAITDEEATRTLTVGDLKRLVRSKVDTVTGEDCLSQRAFYLIRSSAMSLFDVPRRSVRPDTPLDDVVPGAARRERWQQLQSSLGVAELPYLIRPYSVRLIIAILILATLVVTTWYGAVVHPAVFGYWLLTGTITSAIVGWASMRLTQPMKTRFRDGYDKVRDLAQFMVARYPEVVGKPRTVRWTDEEITCLLQEIIKEQLGVSEFNDDSRFVQDLHVD